MIRVGLARTDPGYGAVVPPFHPGKPYPELSDLLGDAAPGITIVKMESPAQRKAGITVPDVTTLVDKLKNEAKVI